LATKGQIKPKADLGAVDSPRKQTNKFVFFAVKSKKSNKNKFICSFFGRICGVPICFWFYLTFSVTVTPQLILHPHRPPAVGLAQL
jgi:hypothetical protein